MTCSDSDCGERVRRALEKELERVDSPATADRVVERVETLAAGKTAAGEVHRAARNGEPAAEHVERAEQIPGPPERQVAATLAASAAEAAAPTSEAPAVAAAAREVLATAPAPPAAERGRELLKEATLRRMGPLDALDARLFLAVNRLPHARRIDRLVDSLTEVTRGGWIWAGAVAVAWLLGARGARWALRLLLPSLAGATWVIENPVKAYFRRRRPFADLVRAMVVGRKPSSWSFPSGHSGSSFAAAWVLSTVWPRKAPLFFGLAGGVALSRIYAGAHYPGDVFSGALAGITLSEAIRRLTLALLGRRARKRRRLRVPLLGRR